MTGFVGALLTPVTVSGAGGTNNVESDWGAVPNNTAIDNRAALNNAFAWLTAVPNRILTFGAGKTYTTGASGVTAKLSITGGNLWKIVGNGSFIKPANGSLSTNGEAPLTITNSTNFVIDTLHVDGNRANRATGSANGSNILLVGALDGGSFLNCISKNAPNEDCWYMSATNSSSLVHTTFPKNMLFYKCTGEFSFRNCMSLIQGRNIQVMGGFYQLASGANPEGGLDLEPNAGPADDGLGILDQVLIRGVTFDGNEGYGAAFSRFVTNTTLEGCLFNGRATVTPTASFTKAAGVHIVGQNHILVRKNTFQNFGTNYLGIDCIVRVQSGFPEGTQDVTVDGNSFNITDSVVAAIFEHGSSGPGPIVFSNNTFFQPAPGNPVYVGAPSWTTVSGNIIVGAPTQPTPTPPWDVSTSPPTTGTVFSIGGAARSFAGSNFSNVVITTTANVAAGSDILVGLSVSNDADTGGPHTCTDTAGNVYAVELLVPATTDHVLDGVILRATDVLALASGSTITVAWPTACPRAAAVAAAAVGLAASAHDQTATTGASSGTTPSSGNITTTQAAELLLGLMTVRGPVADSFTTDPNYTAANVRAGGAAGVAGDNATVAIDARLVSDIETQDYSPTLGTAREYECTVVSFKILGSIPTPTPIAHLLRGGGMSGGFLG